MCWCLCKHLYVCLCFWFRNSGMQRHFISAKGGWRYTSTNEREKKKKDQAKTQVNGRAGWNRKICTKSHCASNVIIGSDSSMWHATLPICQSEIGRVTNGYHCYFLQPPPPPSHSTVCIFFWALEKKSDLNLGGSPHVGGPLRIWILADIRANLTC